MSIYRKGLIVKTILAVMLLATAAVAQVPIRPGDIPIPPGDVPCAITATIGEHEIFIFGLGFILAIIGAWAILQMLARGLYQAFDSLFSFYRAKRRARLHETIERSHS